ncbi:MAG: coenzyme F420-0:L-glutamate ligase [Pseudomonadales bacterium]|nr:coenzyme F420-0:L-glutamate ligase [Pseudomonadales bacterium]
MPVAPVDLSLTALKTLPLIEVGDDLSALIDVALAASEFKLVDGDILVIAQKIISKSEGRYALLDEIEPSAEALQWAAEVDKDPRLVQLILDESKEVVRHRPGVMIVEHRCGYVHANAGIDRSNITDFEGRERVLLLPIDANLSAKQLADYFARQGLKIGIIISDSAGRAWRNGITGFAIGSAAVPALRSAIGASDLFGRPLEVTEMADADELASAASLLMGQGGESVPAVVIRGWDWQASDQDASALIRDKKADLFR